MRYIHQTNLEFRVGACDDNGDNLLKVSINIVCKVICQSFFPSVNEQNILNPAFYLLGIIMKIFSASFHVDEFFIKFSKVNSLTDIPSVILARNQNSGCLKPYHVTYCGEPAQFYQAGLKCLHGPKLGFRLQTGSDIISTCKTGCGEAVSKPYKDVSNKTKSYHGQTFSLFIFKS